MSHPDDIPPSIAHALEMITDAFIALDRNDTCLYLNGPAERLLGRPRAELLGVNVWKLYPGEVDTPFHVALPQARARGVPVTMENFVTTLDRWIENRIFPSPDGLVFIYFRDVTERKMTEQQRDDTLRIARRRTAELETVIEHMPAGVYVGDEDGIHACNALAVRMLGFGSAEELRQAVPNLASLIETRDAETGDRLAPDQEPFLRALQGETCSEKVLVRHVQTGEGLVVRCEAAPIWDDGKVVAAVALNTDITVGWTRFQIANGLAARSTLTPPEVPVPGDGAAQEWTRWDGLSLRRSQVGDTLSIEVIGILMMDTVSRLEAALGPENIADVAHLTLDLRQVDAVDASGLALLVAASKRLRSEKVPLAPRVMVLPNRQPDRILRMGGLSKIMEIVYE